MIPVVLPSLPINIWGKSAKGFMNYEPLKNIQNPIQRLLYFYLNIYTLLVWVSVCLFVSNKVKTVEPIGPKFVVGPRVTPSKVYGWMNFQKFHLNKIRFRKFWKSTKFILKSANFLFFCFTMYSERKFLQRK